MDTQTTEPNAAPRKNTTELTTGVMWVEPKHPLTTDEMLLAEVLARIAQRIATEDYE